VDYDDLLKANPQLKEGLKAGKIIYIPTSVQAEISKPDTHIPTTEEPLKSTDREVPEKGYIEHQVKIFETLNAISRKYGVTVEEIMELNGLEDTTIWFQQILLIPVKKELEEPKEADIHEKEVEEPLRSVEQKPETIEDEVSDEEYIEHKVKIFETLSSISRRYGVTIEEIMELNGLEDTTIWFQQILRIPRTNKVDEPQDTDTRQEENEEPKQADTHEKEIEEPLKGVEQEMPEKDYIKHQVKLFETLSSISRKYGISVEELMEFNELENSFVGFKQILRIPIKKELEEPEEVETYEDEAEEEIPESPLVEALSETEALAKIELLKGLSHFNRRNPIKIALILPFDTHSATPSTNYLDFYSGALMAVEKAKEAGMHISLNTIDISTYSWIGEIFQTNMLKDCDLVVGHIDANRINTFTDYCNSNKIPFVSPLDLQTDSLALHNRYFFQMPVTTATQTTNLIGRINLSNNSRLTLFSDAAGSEEPYRRSILAAIDSAGLPRNEIRYHIVSGRTIIDSLLIIMNPDVEHHIVVASEQEAFASDVIRNMGVLKFNGYNIKVYCSNRVRNFETIEGILLHEVNTHISTNYFVDYGDKATKEFILGYRALFNTEPTPFAFHGYDTFLYFIRIINDLGKDFPDLIYYYPLNMLQNDIRFRRTGPDGGFINIESRDLEYTPDKKITVR
jgi:LysM repeat protein